MTVQDLRLGLDEVRRQFAACLRPEAHNVIQEALSRLDQGEHTGYVIHPDNPLSFKKVYNEELKRHVWADLYCDIQWSGDGDDPLPAAQDLKLRVWSEWSTEGATPEKRLLRDREMEAVAKADAKRNTHDKMILAELDKTRYEGDTRVVYRCHFDRANVGDNGEPQRGPRFHVQFGGAPRADEAPWLSGVIDLPRLPVPPMDAVLACDLIAANFYPDVYKGLIEDFQWRSVVRRSERMLRAYYQRSIEAMDDKKCAVHYWDHPRLTESETAAAQA